MLLGAIADDLTGATDLALTLSRGGMRVVQWTGVPQGQVDLREVDALVIALKSRTIPAGEAVAQSLTAAHALRDLGARQLFFKYCSTFDSTKDGNIGPVADALLDFADAPLTIVCPAFPTNKRTIYQGHLFVGDQLLSDSPMKDHPLTPMRDANLVRVLGAQTKRKVGLVPQAVVAQGAAAVKAAYAQAQSDGISYLVVDAISDADLLAIGTASADLALITGGSGVALGLPQNFRALGLLQDNTGGMRTPAPAGRAIILAGSCSAMTRQQVAAAKTAGLPSFQIDPLAIAAGKLSPDDVVEWVASQDAKTPLVYSSADPADVATVQEKLGRAAVGESIEHLLGAVAAQLADQGFTRFLVAGGETSGAVVAALGVEALRIGPEIDPGVPWTTSLTGRGLALALKSGNFGAPDFFLKAWNKLP
ncbi:MAG: four-carbon acid sugar kinase family protein [Proteobacteria bacterium]|nr:four-carbon acid sugar kinase family protein [Pseudomonadota bacterium]